MSSSLFINDIYSGCLSCSDVSEFNSSIISNIPKDVEKLFGADRPIYIDLPETAPEKLPRYMAFYWIDGFSSEEPHEDVYDGYHLVFVTFVNSISPESVETIQSRSKLFFDEYAEGWCY